MVSNSGTPAGTALHFCTCDSGLYSYFCNSRWSAWSRVSQASRRSSGSIFTRTGSVLISRPTTESEWVSDAGRPDTVAPNTMSSSPL